MQMAVVCNNQPDSHFGTSSISTSHLLGPNIHLQMSSMIWQDLICIKTLKEEGNN
jgi:hypothetical protein